MPNPTADLLHALDQNEDLASGKRKPNRFDVRALFVPLGALILEGDLASFEPLLERLQSFIQADDEQWQRAVAEELTLSTEEYTLSVDPKYLDLSNYDFDYTVRSRETLECRLQAASLLGFKAPEALRGQILSADSRLKPYLDARP